MLKRLILLLIALPILPVSLLAALVERAETAYQKGDYAEASALYLQQLEASPPNAGVLHNLGVSLEKEGRRAPAIAAYLRALQLQPRNADFAYNLRFLLAQNADKLDADFDLGFPALILMDRWAGERELFYASLIFFFLSCLFAAWALTRRRTAFGVTAGLSLLLSLYLLASLVHQLSFAPDLGAVQAPKLEAYAGPTASVVIFELHQGTAVRILESSGDWLKIELSDRKTAWIKSEGVISFGRRQLLGLEALSRES